MINHFAETFSHSFTGFDIVSTYRKTSFFYLLCYISLRYNFFSVMFIYIVKNNKILYKMSIEFSI